MKPLRAWGNPNRGIKAQNLAVEDLYVSARSFDYFDEDYLDVEQDLDPHQCERSDPHPHRRERSDPDPHQSDEDPQQYCGEDGKDRT
jgi:hypothetical protein